MVDDILGKWLPATAVKADLDFYPATPLQANMIVQSMQSRDSYINQIHFEVRSSTLSMHDVQTGVLALMEAHSILRTRFVPGIEGVYQVLTKPSSTLPVIAVASSLLELCRDQMALGFGPEDEQWFRVGVVQSSSDSSLTHLILTIHHVLYDGWCLERLVVDLISGLDGLPIMPSPPFKNLVQYIEGQDVALTQAYWQTYLSGWEGSSSLRLGQPSQQGEKYVPISLTCEMPMKDLNEAASRHQVTMTSLAKAAWALTLREYMQTDDVVFGNVISGRDMAFPGAAR